MSSNFLSVKPYKEIKFFLSSFNFNYYSFKSSSFRLLIFETLETD